MQIEFTCPHCGAVNQTSSINQGNSVRCSSCAGLVDVDLLPEQTTQPPPINEGQCICESCGHIAPIRTPKPIWIEVSLWLIPIILFVVIYKMGGFDFQARNENYTGYLVGWVFSITPAVFCSNWRRLLKRCQKCSGNMVNVSSSQGLEILKHGPLKRQSDSICSHCGIIGNGVHRGSQAVEIGLYLLFCGPGIIYSLWRGGGRVCAHCRGQLIKIASPRGVELMERYHKRKVK